MALIPDSILNNIISGRVLDDNGAWVPIAAMLAKERDFLRHLQDGQVIIDDRWVTIEEAKKANEGPANSSEGAEVTRL
jgi:hypothetical protein